MRKGIDGRWARGSGAGLLLALVLAAAVAGLASSVSGAPSRGDVVVVAFDVPVDPGSSSLMANALAAARTNDSPALVIEMNTPGGLIRDMTQIVSTIEDANQSGIPTYTYVPPNALAASAGSYIAMASNRILMGPGSEIGPSTPIVVGGTALEQNHTEGAMMSLMVSLAEKWGRNATAARSMVVSDVAFSATEAQSNHLVDGGASTLQTALAQLGLTGGYTVVKEGIFDQFLSALSDPNVTGMLILLGALAIVLDLLHPTFVLSVAGGVALVAGLVGAEVVGVSSLGLVVILAGVALMLLELKLGHGLAMVSGAVVGGAGVYLLFQGVGVSTSAADVTQVEAVIVAAVGVLCGLYVRWVVGPLRNRGKLTGAESLPGKLGVVSARLAPLGEVRVEGITWRARSASGEIGTGETVRVKAVEHLVLVVEKSEGQADRAPS